MNSARTRATSARRLGAVSALLLLLGSQSAWALYCGNRLVSEGDSPGRVRHLCGSPLDIDEQAAPVTYGAYDRRSGRYIEKTILQTETIYVYNFGPRRLMQELRFRNGRLVDTRSLGYGY